MVLVAQLKSAKSPDPYNKLRPDHPRSVGVEKMTNNTAADKTQAN